MDLLSTNCCFRLKSCNLHLLSASQFLGRDRHICGKSSSQKFSTKLCFGYGGNIKALASQKQTKKSRKRGKMQKRPDEYDGVDRPSSRVDVGEANKMFSSDTVEVQTSVLVPSRSSVLQACTVSSGLIGALGVLIRQVSHVTSTEGWPVLDCSADITFSFESWHLGLIMGSVISVSSCRFLLLMIWPDFAESSEATNQQVLSSLEPLDFLVVAFLPGISEELLFRGALLPLFGINWTSIFAVAAYYSVYYTWEVVDFGINWTSIFAVAAYYSVYYTWEVVENIPLQCILFGVLHLGSGRKYSFAIWATFVGLVYGYATILSSSITVPMASHALNNLVGGIIWRYSSNSSKQIG